MDAEGLVALILLRCEAWLVVVIGKMQELGMMLMGFAFAVCEDVRRCD